MPLFFNVPKNVAMQQDKVVKQSGFPGFLWISNKRADRSSTFLRFRSNSKMLKITSLDHTLAIQPTLEYIEDCKNPFSRKNHSMGRLRLARLAHRLDKIQGWVIRSNKMFKIEPRSYNEHRCTRIKSCEKLSQLAGLSSE